MNPFDGSGYLHLCFLIGGKCNRLYRKAIGRRGPGAGPFYRLYGFVYLAGPYPLCQPFRHPAFRISTAFAALQR